MHTIQLILVSIWVSILGVFGVHPMMTPAAAVPVTVSVCHNRSVGTDCTYSENGRHYTGKCIPAGTTGTGQTVCGLPVSEATAQASTTIESASSTIRSYQLTACAAKSVGTDCSYVHGGQTSTGVCIPVGSSTTQTACGLPSDKIALPTSTSPFLPLAKTTSTTIPVYQLSPCQGQSVGTQCKYVHDGQTSVGVCIPGGPGAVGKTVCGVPVGDTSTIVATSSRP